MREKDTLIGDVLKDVKKLDEILEWRSYRYSELLRLRSALKKAEEDFLEQEKLFCELSEKYLKRRPDESKKILEEIHQDTLKDKSNIHLPTP